MIQKNSLVNIADKSGALTGNVFHTYRGGSKKISCIGEFVKVSLRRVKPDIKLKKKSKVRGLLINLKFKSLKNDGSNTYFYENNIILIKRKLITRSKDFIVPTDRNVLRKKLLYKFSGIL